MADISKLKFIDDVVYDIKDVAARSALTGKLDSSLKGAANGVAELDSTGKVPSSQLPSFVDDVIECDEFANFPSTGETGKIYVDKSTNKTYRWGGTAYVEISASLALGTTSSTAFRGDYGNSAYAHAVTNKGSAFSSGFYKIATNSEGHVTGATDVAKSDITALGIPGSDTHRPVQVNGTEVLGNNTTALNLKAGNNVSLSNSSGAVTIAATDTKYIADTSKLVTTTVPNVTSVGSAPTLGTAIPADDITSWTTNTPTSFSISGETLTIVAGTAASLSYTAKSIPNVTSVGSAPTLGTSITVATGSLSSTGGGGSVATGITAS